MTTAFWMACVVIAGLIAAVAGLAAALTIGPVLDRWFQNKPDR